MRNIFTEHIKKRYKERSEDVVFSVFVSRGARDLKAKQARRARSGKF